ncbi:MAG: 4,5-dihydroxyphthalate decarboxylase [Alphaproteobacteria bacterium]|jgi:4,5-dihydroxyphthalate decarboxylase|nr:4,5-dihydroxyphthalate decarboxylase [Alphaproteobacteria bacterium]
MAARFTLTIACDDFDHIRALMDGTVKPQGIDLVFITQLTNPERHGRMVRELAFDVCELNMPTYLIARDSGVPITAIPIFLFRKFRHGNVYINPQSGITKPEDLIGQRIGCTTMQPASNVWINGILQDRHGVPHRQQTWVVERDEDAPFARPAWLKVERVPRGKAAVSMLLDGELPALMTPQTPKPILDGDKRIARLFPDHVERERAYFKETSIFPIMHVTAIKQEIVDRYPWVPMMLCRAFEEAKQLAYQRMANVRVVPLPWFAAHWEEERKLFGPDPWAYGLGAANRKTLETAVRYTHEQGMTSRLMTVDEIFVPGCM